MENSEVKDMSTEEFGEVIKQYGGDSRFWSFVASFAATIGFDMQSGADDKAARLMIECARQYGYLSKEHPNYFNQLYTDTGAVGVVWTKVAAVALISGVPEGHFAKAGYLKLVYEKAVGVAEAKKAEELRKAEQIARFQAELAEMKKNPPRIEKPIDAFEITGSDLTTDEIEGRALAFYAASKGKLVKVRNHVPLGGDNLDYQRTSSIFKRYDIAIVDEGGEEYVGLTEPHGELAESTWPVVMLTGPNRGQKASIAAPDFKADGSVVENDLVMFSLPGFVLRERMSDDELIELVRLDMLDYAERSIDVTAATVYLAGTDDQETISFDPPLRSVVVPFEEGRGSFDSKYRLDDWSQSDAISVIDVYLDFESTEERADAYRSMWTHGLSYTSHGLMEVGETPLLPFVPAFVARKNDNEPAAIVPMPR